jgi:RHS repeat-associated protein
MGCGEPDDGDECDSGWSIFDDVELCLPGRWDAGEEECYDGQMPVEEDNNSIVTRNFVGARGLEAMFTTANNATTAAYPLYDTHGNMVATLSKNTAGTSWDIVSGSERAYDVWGGVRSGATTGGPKGRYVANLGHVQDDESGLIYMRARYYEPETGRFVSEDPEMDGRNWYSYCKNEPITRVDVTGKSWEDDGFFLLGTLLYTLGFGLAGTGLKEYAAGLAYFKTSEAYYRMTDGALGGAGMVLAGMAMKQGAIKALTGAMLMWAGRLFLALGEDASEFVKDIAEMVLQFVDLAGGYRG